VPLFNTDLKLSPDPWAITKYRGKKEVMVMVRTKAYGNLSFIGYIDMKKIGGYKKLIELFDNNNISYDINSISSKYSVFNGGNVYLSDKDFTVISSYSRLVRPRFIPIRKLYVYELYIISKNDFYKIKDKLPIKQN
jgi:hypothetical protein